MDSFAYGRPEPMTDDTTLGAGEIIAGARSSFLDSADWAYLAGIAILVGAALVSFVFPRKRQEEELLASYHGDDTATRAGGPSLADTARVGAAD